MMPAIFVKRYRREDLRANSDKLYVFGDNLVRRGLGGQAKECRGEPNAIGIPTKREPTWNGFLCDDDYDEWCAAVAGPFMQIAQAMDEGKTVVWPQDGIGTGLADLEKQAPKIWRDLQARIASLEGPAQSEGETALEALAEIMHREMEYLDPSGEQEIWSNLAENQKDIYRCALRRVLWEKSLVEKAFLICAPR